MSLSSFPQFPSPTYNTSTMEVSEEIVKEEIARAINLFRQQNYEACLSEYNKILAKLGMLSDEYCMKLRRYYELRQCPLAGKLCHPKLTSILDQRAATYEKLGDFESALADASQILALDPLECKGYLRSGKLLLAGGERVKAYKCYQRGLHVIEKASQNRDFSFNKKLMKQLSLAFSSLNKVLKEEKAASTSPSNQNGSVSTHDLPSKTASMSKNETRSNKKQTQSSLDDMFATKRSVPQENRITKKSRNTKDFMERLPLDVIAEIYSHIKVEQILKSHLVSKMWYRTLLKLPRLYLGAINLKTNIMHSEFSNCMLLLKKLLNSTTSRQIGRIVIPTTFKEHHLQRILQDLLQKDLRIRALGVTSMHFSMEMLLRMLVNLNGAGLDKLQLLKRLIVTVNSSFTFNDVIPKLFPELTNLELIIIDKVQKIPAVQLDMLRELSGKVEAGLLKSEHLQSVPLESHSKKMHRQLKSLVLVNQRQVAKYSGPDTDSNGMYKVKPAILAIQMPQLSSLTIACFDFTGYSNSLTRFLSQTPNLKSLDLESNSALSLDKLLRILISSESSFELETLRFREVSQSGPLELEDINLHDVKCLSTLRELDLYGTSLSNMALLKLLHLSENIHTLNIGNSKYLYFKNSQFSRHSPMNWVEMLKLLPRLESLYMPEMDFDHLTMTQLNKALLETYGTDVCLKLMDLSSCHSIDGISLLYLFEASKRGNVDVSPQICHLILNGLTIAKQTLHLLEQRNHVQSISNDPFKTTWRTWGINSHCIEKTVLLN